MTTHDEVREAAEKWARNCVLQRGVPHTHDLSDAFVAGTEWRNEARSEQLMAMRKRCINKPCYNPDEFLCEWEDGTIHCWECEWYAMEKERDIYRSGFSASDDRIACLLSQLQASKQENERLREALEFYAEKSNWVSRSGKIGICPIDTTDRETFGPEYPWAGGKRAREALKGGA